MTRLVSILAFLALGACADPPRSAAYFEAHPDEAEQALAACWKGELRGEECRTAQAGLAAARRSARMEMYRRGFER